MRETLRVAKKTVAWRVEEDMLSELREISEETGQSVSNVARMILRFGIHSIRKRIIKGERGISVLSSVEIPLDRDGSGG